VERADLKRLLRATGCAVERGEFVFLCDPSWPAAERAEAENQMNHATADSDSRTGWLCVRTGGSGGSVKFARHDESTFSAAVRGFCTHFEIVRVNAIDVLPAHHVSGLMSRVRSAMTGGQYLAWDWKRLQAGETPDVTGEDWVLSLVPTQLQRLIGSSAMVAWLRRLQMIFVGGGPTWPELADEAAAAGLRISLSYGMTETAAMIAALTPDEFRAGERSCGRVMPHAHVTVDDSSGVVSVGGESLFRGYWPALSGDREFTTDDVGRIDARGYLHIVGRRDAVIITGGKKVQPEEVEAALRASAEFADVAVVGVADPEWGEVVVACYPERAARNPDLEHVQRAIDDRLSAFQRPKRYVALADWPRTLHGKVDRAALRATVSDIVRRSAK
jgi:o-succinylbenzoate---CoA ligase